MAVQTQSRSALKDFLIQIWFLKCNIQNITFRMNVTDSDNDMGNFEEGNRDKIRLRIIFMCFAIGVGVGVMACVHVGRKVSCAKIWF